MIIIAAPLINDSDLISIQQKINDAKLLNKDQIATLIKKNNQNWQLKKNVNKIKDFIKTLRDLGYEETLRKIKDKEIKISYQKGQEARIKDELTKAPLFSK